MSLVLALLAAFSLGLLTPDNTAGGGPGKTVTSISPSRTVAPDNTAGGGPGIVVEPANTAGGGPG